MKKFVIVLAILGFASVVQAATITINYDGTGFDQPTQILGYYSGLPGGPVHSAGFMWLDYGGSISDTYGPHSLTAMAFAIDTNPVWVQWSAPVTGVSFWYGYAYPLSVDGYLGGTLAFSSGVLPQNSGGMFEYVAPGASIDKLVFNGTADYWTMDDLSYSTGSTTVPEPASLLLLGTGLVGLVGAARRRMRK